MERTGKRARKIQVLPIYFCVTDSVNVIGGMRHKYGTLLCFGWFAWAATI